MHHPSKAVAPRAARKNASSVSLDADELEVIRTMGALHGSYETSRRLQVSEQVALRAMAGLPISRLAAKVIRNQLRP